MHISQCECGGGGGAGVLHVHKVHTKFIENATCILSHFVLRKHSIFPNSRMTIVYLNNALHFVEVIFYAFTGFVRCELSCICCKNSIYDQIQGMFCIQRIAIKDGW